MDNCFVKMNEIRSSLPNTEKKVIDMILLNPKKVCLFTVTELAEYTHSSPATVTRMCKSLGYSGYKEFNKKLILDLSLEEESGDHSKDFMEVLPNDDMQDIIDKVCMNNTLAIRNTQYILDRDAIAKAVESIDRAEKIYFYGLAESANACLVGAYRFMRLGKAAFAFTVFHDQLFSVASLTNRDVAVLFSYSGETESIIELARLLKGEGIKTISITRFSNNRLAELCDIPIKITAIGSSIRLISSGQQIAQLNMLDIIYSAVASKSLKRMNDLNDKIIKILNSEKYKEYKK